jgi:hypothetical protein
VVLMVPTIPVPLTLQLTALLAKLLTMAMNCCVPFVDTSVNAGDTEIPGCAAARMVTCAVADEVGLAWLVAVIATIAGVGTTAGAVYWPGFGPPFVMDPTVALPPTTPATLHCTVVFAVPVTLATNCCVMPDVTFMFVGATLTCTICWIVIAAVPDALGVDVLVAVTVTLEGDGTAAGAV